MFSRSVLVTGSNRGIGLEFVKQLASRTEFLIAGCRSVSEELKSLADEHKNIHIVKFDITKQEEIDTAFENVKDIVQEAGLSCLINNAAIVDWSQKKIEDVTSEALMNIFQINTIAPAMVIKKFLSLVRLASNNCTGDVMNVSRGAIINLTARTGSISDNHTAGLYGSRITKAGLNMLTKNLSIELKDDKIICCVMSPGWVKTRAGGENAVLTTQESVEKMLNIFTSMDSESTGKFLSWDSQIIPW